MMMRGLFLFQRIRTRSAKKQWIFRYSMPWKRDKRRLRLSVRCPVGGLCFGFSKSRARLFCGRCIPCGLKGLWSNVWIDSWGLKGTGIPFQVGLHEDLIKINAGTGLDSHHVGQKALMDKLVANYDEMKAPAILVPSVGHTRTKDGVGIVSRSPINPKTGKPFTNARELLARDIRELRRVYGDTISNKQLQELINLNKSMYPEMNKPKTGHH